MTSMSSNGVRSIRNGGTNRSIINNNHNKHATHEAAAVDIVRCTTSLRDPPNRLPSLANGSVSGVQQLQGHLEQREHATNGPPTPHRRSTNTGRLPANESAMCCLETPGDDAKMPTPGTSASIMSNSDPLTSGQLAPPASSGDVPPRPASANSTASSSAASSTGNRKKANGPDRATVRNEAVDIVDEDPYAELERILEKAQAEISEMFAQTVREEKMNCGSVSSSAGGMEQPEGGSQLKRKNESKTAGGSSSRSSSGRQYQPQLHQQKNHRQQSSHHAKYATIAHPNFTQHHYGQAIGAATLGRNRQQAADHEPKRTRNTFDPRYRSHDPLEVVSSTTGGGGRSPQPVGEAPSSSQSTSDVGSYSGRNATEHSDSLSDDMSLLDVGAVSAHEDSLEGAGGDTSDERETIVRRRYQRQSPRSSSTAAVRGTGQKSAAAAGYYASQMEPLADRSIKSSTNSLPSVAGHRNLALHLKFKSHQSAIDAKRKQFFLALDQEPFQPLNRSNMADLPSPSSTSLHSGHSHLIAEELGTKSSSAPVLLKDEENVLTVARANLRYSRSQSDRHLAEIEAIEACRWLRAAGFPQYAQMYEDHQFPIVVEDVAKDHPFLENDPLQSLFRRLHTLNRCANMHLDSHQHTPKPSQRDDSDDDSCALSEAWTFQHNSRRWSRVDDAIGLVSVINNKQQHKKDGYTKGTGNDPSVDGSSGNPQHQQQHQQRKHNTLLRAEDHEKLWLEGGGKITIGVPSDTDSQDDSIGGTVHLRRTGSERLKDGAKAILRRVESIKSRRRKKQNRDGLIILAPPSGGSHLSPHRTMDDGTPGGFDIMSYSNPTSPRPSAEMRHFDDAIDAAGNRKNLFASELASRNLLSPNVNAWDGKRYGDRSSSPVTSTIGAGPLQFRQQVQLQHEARSGDDSSSICSEDSVGGGGVGGGGGGDISNSSKSASWKYPRAKKALRSKVVTSTVADDPTGGALSDSEYHASQRRSRIKVELASDMQGGVKDGVSTTSGNSNKQSGKAGAASGNTLAAPDANTPSKLHRGGSLNLGKASKRYRDAFSNRSVRHSAKAGDDWEGRSTSKRSTVARWHSFQQPKVSPIGVQQQQQQSDQLNVIASNVGSKEDRKQHQQQQQQQQRGDTTLVSSSNVSIKLHKPPVGAGLEGKPLQLLGDPARSGAQPAGGTSGAATVGLRMSEMSCGQLLVVRKLGLANLTGYMERYCPTHRSGWNWDLPKFIKRIKTPDYKDRKVFGIPLVLNLQKYGSTVPYTIRMAFAWLERNALDQSGLFRRSGMKSRILNLKSIIEASNDVGFRGEMFDEYHAYDVADLVKQYFRELPDPLLTAKLSETFLSIFQYLPDEVRAEAVQSAILLLPDEHREVLYLLLTFFDQVVQSSDLNQMTAYNLAVCFGPSLFYLQSGNRFTAASPRRKKTGALAGQPDEKDKAEAKALHDCLEYMIEHFQTLWTITNDQMRRCNFNYLDESKPVLLASLGAEMHVQNWRGYLTESINECLREGRERPRGWVSLSSTDPSVAVFFKKVGDGHPLRLWKCVTEVEAPPVEVMQHIVNERSLWDAYLLKWRTIEQLDPDTDVFQYACGQPITEYCVVRQWKNERGACVIVEVSISHESATSLLGGVNGVVLASRYLIEPCGSGKCKLMHLSRVDMKGRTPDWYNKNYGHICQQYLSKIKKFFEHYTEGPETKV